MLIVEDKYKIDPIADWALCGERTVFSGPADEARKTFVRMANEARDAHPNSYNAQSRECFAYVTDGHLYEVTLV